MEKYIKNQAEFGSMSEKERMVSGNPYQPSDPELCEDRLKAREIIYEFNRSAPKETAKRSQLINELFGSVKDSQAFIEPDFRVDYGYNIHVGEKFMMNFGCCILDCAKVEIGDNVLIGPNVHIYAATHPIEGELRDQFELAKPVKIGNDVWIGGNVTICPGVTVGNNVTIAAGAVVVKDVPDNVVVGGNPAKILKQL